MVVATGWRPGAACGDLVRRVVGQLQEPLARGRDGSAGQVSAEEAAALVQVLQLGGSRGQRDVGGKVRVEVAVTERHLQAVPEGPQVFEGELLHLVGGVATLEVGAERPSLDGLGQHDGRLAPVPQGRVVGGVHLPAVVSAAFEAPDLGVGHAVDHREGARVAGEEVLAHEGAGLGLVGLEVTVGGRVEQVDQGSVVVGAEERVPLASPDDLDDVPAGAAEVGLQLLDDLAVAADRSVEALQVAVDDEGEVVQPFPGGDAERPQCLGLVHLAVADERPDVLAAGVLDAAVVQVAVEPGLVDGADRAQAHRDGGELPEVGHQPGMRVRRQAAALAGVRDLLTEAVQLVCAQASLEEGAGVDAR